MKLENVEKFKKLFEEQRKSLVYSKSIIDEGIQIQKDDMFDETDWTSMDMEMNMRMRLRNREALFLKKIDEALERIEEGVFGDCESCGNEIELKRLDARPTATLCVSCKEDQERMEHLHADGRKHKSVGRRLKLA